MAKSKKSSRSDSRYDNFTNTHKALYGTLTDFNKTDGNSYLQRCKTLSSLYELAKKERGMLKPLKADLLSKFGIKHSTATKMVAVSFTLANVDSQGEKMIAQYVAKGQKSKLEFMASLNLRKRKGKETGRFQGMRIESDCIAVDLGSPQEYLDIQDMPFTKLQALVGMKRAQPSSSRATKALQERKLQRALDVIEKLDPTAYADLCKEFAEMTVDGTGAAVLSEHEIEIPSDSGGDPGIEEFLEVGASSLPGFDEDDDPDSPLGAGKTPPTDEPEPDPANENFAADEMAMAA